MATMELQLVIALGSNLGDRYHFLTEARAKLEAKFGPSEASAIYQTAPVDCPAGSLPFLNAVLLFALPASTEQLLNATQAVETALGRPSDHAQNSPRTVDVDILCCGELEISTPQLTLPHPRLHQRRFVLEPLADLCPDARLPRAAQTVREMLENLDSDEPPLRVFLRHWPRPPRQQHCYRYPRPAVTVDVVLLSQGHVLLIQRAHEPFAGAWAFPGGFVDENEDLEAAARRELHEETGLVVPVLRQINAYGTPGRDPRGHTVSVAFLATLPSLSDYAPQAADDASAAAWKLISDLPKLAFDHAYILADALSAENSLN